LSQPSPRSTRAKWLAIGGIAVLCIAVAVLAGVLFSRFSGSVAEGAGPTDGITGDLDEWIAAVCAAATISDGSDIVASSNATAGSICQARLQPRGSTDSILILRFETEQSMLSDLARSHIRFYASAPIGEERIAFAPISPEGDEQLAPLKKFGFEILPLS